MKHSYPPALLYHKVERRWEGGFTWVSPMQFRRQMKRLHAEGWRTILPDYAVAGSTSENSGEDRRFIIAFDDGYEGVLGNALPVLDELGFRAIVFIPVGYIGRFNGWDHHLFRRWFRHLDWGGLRELSRAGWGIGSHSVSHLSLTTLPARRLVDELVRSRAELEEGLGMPVTWISFPFGRYDDRVVSAAVEAGYRGAVVSVTRRVRPVGGFRLIPADAVYRWDGPGLVAGRVKRGTGYPLGRAFRRVVNGFSGGTVVLQSLSSGRSMRKTVSN